jgi:hypothetical protein
LFSFDYVSVSDCVAILLQVIMGDGFAHKIVVVAVQQTVTTVAVTTQDAPAASTSSVPAHVITREEWEAMQRETAEARKAAIEAQRQLEILRKQTAPSNPGSSHSARGDGPLISLQTQETTADIGLGPMSTAEALLHLQRQIAARDQQTGEAASLLAQLWEAHQKSQSAPKSGAAETAASLPRKRG